MTLNAHVSVDCVIFGYNENKLKVLLIERENTPQYHINGHRLKLPGSLIAETEDLDISARRTLNDLTGLENIFMSQFAVFSSPDRLTPAEDLLWLRKTTGLVVNRVVTIAYYALIKISEGTINDRTIWRSVNELPELIFDHNMIINRALETLRREVHNSPLCFELLPRKFSLRQMQDIYEAILGEHLDNRNFRKKIRPLEFIVPLDEKEKNVNHKPAQLYCFNKKIYEKHKKIRSGFDL